MPDSSGDAKRLPFDCTALVLQGGGALGSYQCGVFEALYEAGIRPNWIAGISIGAINAAIIAGNKPEDRCDRLHQFWDRVTSGPSIAQALPQPLLEPDLVRSAINWWSAWTAASAGAPGMFAPRLVPPWLGPAGSTFATSYYDTAPLWATLTELVDFDRINSGETRLSVGSVNIRSGNFVYFDSTRDVIRPEHIMASSALPPAFPPIEIDGELYWDGGLVSNTPLQWVADNETSRRTLAFQIDLWSARGSSPRTLAESLNRLKEITYSSRTRATTDQFKTVQRLRNRISEFLHTLPEECRCSEAYRVLEREADLRAFKIVHLIYQSRSFEAATKDFEFSRLSMEEHWRAGRDDAARTLAHPEALELPGDRFAEGVETFDVLVDGRR